MTLFGGGIFIKNRVRLYHPDGLVLCHVENERTNAMSSMSDTIVTETWPTKCVSVDALCINLTCTYTHTQMRAGFAIII